MYEFVSGKKVTAAKDLCMGMLRELKGRLKEGGLEAKIDLIGSAAGRNMVTRRVGEPFDLDFNLRFADPGRDLKSLKDLVRNALDSIATAKGFSYGQDSTSVITYKHKADGAADFTLDVGIIVVKEGRAFRLINKKAQGAYVLEESASLPGQVERMVACIDRNKQATLLKETYLRLKNLHARRGEADTHPSSAVCLEALNEACLKIGQQGGAAMAKGHVSSGTHTQQQMNHHANQGNPNNSANRAASNNRSNQLNPNNSAYQGKK